MARCCTNLTGRSKLRREASCADTDIGDLSPEALEHYQKKAGLPEDADSDEFFRRLARQGLLLKEEDGVYIPSGFGILLLGQRPRDRFQQAGLLATVGYPNGKDEIRNFDEPYVLIPNLLEEWLHKVLPLTIDRSKMERLERSDVPFELIREAVVNALVHRDYEIDGGKCQLFINADTIVVKSPGAPLPPITLEQMKSFAAPMLSRNPKLHYVFAQIDAAEERGLGLDSLKNGAARLGLPRPSYTFEDPYLVLTIFRSMEAFAQSIGEEGAIESLNRGERKGWEWLITADSATAAEYEAALGVSRTTAHTHLNRFIALGLVQRQGSGPATVYKIQMQ